MYICVMCCIVCVYRWACNFFLFASVQHFLFVFFFSTIASTIENLRTKSYNLLEFSSLGTETREIRSFIHPSEHTATPSLPIVVYIILYMYRSELFLYLKTTHNATTLFHVAPIIATHKIARCRSRETHFFPSF